MADVLGRLAARRRRRLSPAPGRRSVAAVTAAYGRGNPGRGGGPAAAPFAGAADAGRRGARVRSPPGADNGAAAERPFPTASMVKLFLAEDILRRARAGES